MTKRLSKSAADRISNLPDGAIERILVFLPIKDAARTSVLSRNWRHRWGSIPQLVFDGSFGKAHSADENNKLMMNIYEALLVHDGPITKFELAVPGLLGSSQTDKLILHLSRKGVRELSLRFGGPGYTKLHSSLFSAFQLNVLKLRCCEFSAPSSFVGFGKLTFLELKRVALPHKFFERFLPECPLLQKLRVSDCNNGKHVFAAPSLKAFFFHSVFWTISFTYTPLLSVLSVVDNGKFRYSAAFAVKYKLDMVALFASLPALQQLTLGFQLLMLLAEGHVPSRLLTALHHLKVLELPCLLLDRLPQARVLVCLIMSSPNLQTLTIRIDPEEDGHPPSEVIASLQKLLEAEEQPGACCLQRLEEVNIQDSRGTQVELDLVRFVLANAPVLCRISIKRKEKLPCKTVTKFLNEMILYKRLSKEAEVKYV